MPKHNQKPKPASLVKSGKKFENKRKKPKGIAASAIAIQMAIFKRKKNAFNRTWNNILFKF